MAVLPIKETTPKENLEDFIIYLHGMPGIGKSTFCSQFPNPIFASTEPGLNSLTTWNTPIPDWNTFLLFAKEISEGKHEFKTIIIDTVDNLYKYCLDFICQKNKINWPAEKDYGQGWAMVRDEFMRVITKLALLPYGLVAVSHTKFEEIKTRTGSYNKAVPTLSKQGNEIIMNLADISLYMDTTTEEGVESRVIKTKPSAYWTAKDKTKRNIPEIIELPIAKESEMFTIFSNAFYGIENNKGDK